MKIENYKKMIEKKDVFDNRKMRLSLVDASAISNSCSAINKDCLILLNKTNSIKVEDAIKNDLAYVNYIKMVYESIKANNGGVFPECDRASIVALVKIIDYENSTDVWIHCNDSFFKMVDFIIDPKCEFWDRLKKGDPELVDDLTNFSEGKVWRRPRGKEEKEEKKAKFPSLASKICKYLAQYVLGKDYYYINDKFIRKVLPYYYHYYLGKKIAISQDNYADLFSKMEKLHAEISKTDTLTKNELDHIMWYCYKSSGE